MSHISKYKFRLKLETNNSQTSNEFAFRVSTRVYGQNSWKQDDSLKSYWEWKHADKLVKLLGKTSSSLIGIKNAVLLRLENFARKK